MAGKTDPPEVLARVALFADLSEGELGAIANVAKELERDAGEVLAREGEGGVGFFLILEGTAEVSVKGEILTELRAGESFGEISLLDGGPRTATVTATSRVRMLGVTAWAFKGLVQQHPEMAVKLLRVLAGYVRRSVGGGDSLSSA